MVMSKKSQAAVLVGAMVIAFVVVMVIGLSLLTVGTTGFGPGFLLLAGDTLAIFVVGIPVATWAMNRGRQ